MYVGFELNDYQPLREIDSSEIEDFEAQEKGAFDRLSDYMVGQFQGKDVIDAEKLAEHLFPGKKAHVFLSHSHLDADRAKELAIALRDKELDVFVDSCVWGHFDKLLSALNNVYADPVKTPEGGVVYDYKKATELTAGVHMMLLGALQAMIDRSELFVFLNTNNSVPLTTFSGVERTLSPWIYSELQFSATARSRVPPRYCMGTESLSLEEERRYKAIASTSALFSFTAFNTHLPKVKGDQLRTWFNGTDEERDKALDSLYEHSNIAQEFTKLRQKLEKRELEVAQEVDENP
ncbi:toll/interleukin-1 receptor domain-containing protein [Pseudomonas guariconensis]|uniref:toll/interleukin-1 receptor domain-containing protein n=1 Tax=Pseudomonas guariconensis TaxID=1288410 RepID=UPI0018A9243A|nr:toll/interleukin-1 receptor domain-containing protein [Pseudomonas guariconensis]MBF8742093.1 toll/interleukin-1 receptor domain-containing protein [Pseudomonas guariconensis]MBF8751089.1 toll/interleukin-1 receptor domain-containing protein [Pseudomonas guariconensis]